jgi:hypothetical protein
MDLLNTGVIIVGDFNIADIGGSSGCLSGGSALTRLFNSTLAFLDLESHNNIQNCNSRTLDIVITDRGSKTNVFRETPLVPEDPHHPTLLVTVCMPFSCYHHSPGPESVVSKYNFRRGNFLLLYDLLKNVHWSSISQITDVDEAVDFFYRNMYECFDVCIPRMKPTCKRKYPPWFTSQIINDFKRKNRYAKKRRYSSFYENRFQKLRRDIKTNIRIAFLTYIDSFQHSIKQNPERFWDFVKSKKNGKGEHIPHTVELNGVLYSGSDIVTAFSEYFSSVFIKSNSSYNAENIFRSNAHGSGSSDNFNIPEFSLLEVVDAINKLKSKKSSGPDGIPPYIIKGCGEILAQPICHIFNVAIRTCTFPDALKIARVTPIFKSGSKESVENYRPISLINNRFFWITKSKITEFQHGFMPRRSTASNLLHFTNLVNSVFVNGGRMDVVYTDLSKAFDTVDHGILLNKLFNFGFSVNTVQFVASYLYKRTQYVEINFEASNTYCCTSGVPQGSNLGPLLFLFMINDLPLRVKSYVLLYADDVKIFRPIINLNDKAILQRDLDRLVDWCHTNKLKININKCSVVSFARKVDLSLIDNTYVISGQILKTCTSIKDLGIMFDSSLKFDAHINSAINSSLKLLGFICRHWLISMIVPWSLRCMLPLYAAG